MPSYQSPKRTIEMKDLENNYCRILLPTEASFVLPKQCRLVVRRLGRGSLAEERDFHVCSFQILRSLQFIIQFSKR